MQAGSSHRDVCAESEKNPPAPDWVSDFERWPWWRRRLESQSAQARRIAAWNSLRGLLRRPAPTLVWKPLEAQGIFGNAVCRVDAFNSDERSRLAFTGQAMLNGELIRMKARSPYGPLVISATTDNFTFDITEIEGIAESKSSDRYFTTVQDFGVDYIAAKRVQIDVTGLAMMLAHDQVRIRNPGTLDSVGLRLWDGKLFLNNAGGSHHFAGAAYIAKQLTLEVPMRARHELIAVNPLTVEWLLSTFMMLAVPKAHVATSLVAKLAGSCFELDVPSHICADATLLLILNEDESIHRVAEALCHAGALNVGPWFCDLLARQDRNLGRHKERFGGRVTYPPALQGL